MASHWEEFARQWNRKPDDDVTDALTYLTFWERRSFLEWLDKKRELQRQQRRDEALLHKLRQTIEQVFETIRRQRLESEEEKTKAAVDNDCSESCGQIGCENTGVADFQNSNEIPQKWQPRAEVVENQSNDGDVCVDSPEKLVVTVNDGGDLWIDTGEVDRSSSPYDLVVLEKQFESAMTLGIAKDESTPPPVVLSPTAKQQRCTETGDDLSEQDSLLFLGVSIESHEVEAHRNFDEPPASYDDNAGRTSDNAEPLNSANNAVVRILPQAIEYNYKQFEPGGRAVEASKSESSFDNVKLTIDSVNEIDGGNQNHGQEDTTYLLDRMAKRQQNLLEFLTLEIAEIPKFDDIPEFSRSKGDSVEVGFKDQGERWLKKAQEVGKDAQELREQFVKPWDKTATGFKGGTGFIFHSQYVGMFRAKMRWIHVSGDYVFCVPTGLLHSISHTDEYAFSWNNGSWNNGYKGPVCTSKIVDWDVCGESVICFTVPNHWWVDITGFQGSILVRMRMDVDACLKLNFGVYHVVSLDSWSWNGVNDDAENVLENPIAEQSDRLIICGENGNSAPENYVHFIPALVKIQAIEALDFDAVFTEKCNSVGGDNLFEERDEVNRTGGENVHIPWVVVATIFKGGTGFEIDYFLARIFASQRPHVEKLQPAMIFIDEVDSFLGQRKSSDHEAMTNMKTEFMALWDGFPTDHNACVMVLAATNRPSALDEAILRHLSQAFEIGYPDRRERAAIVKVILKGEKVEDGVDYDRIAALCDGYTGFDMFELCKKLPITQFGIYSKKRTRGPALLGTHDYCRSQT